mmetsp:Transcript_7936/g.19403  ORF Transcript_7936/g.19403 Transcript_7936/m.19403 type:complete len:449 (-) Transcript_7936:105-1451(-)|eukprot:CAMPEP_0114149112 /NCGR_PEP_ID=MMETSP0043_2-20121206/21982_1 /TAXON_ID=464988 /ORGANISM="Hemiselmis andersenii, Strain CCMP644" /LENGTH=448 /DNA_ID=CAMNT_0001243727 /DNA_START=37 /DNA_END=1383 /DNA_ORIENTATION=-
MADIALLWGSEEDEAIRWPPERQTVPPKPPPSFQVGTSTRKRTGEHLRSSPHWGKDEMLRVCSINVCSTANGATVKTTTPVREGGLTHDQIVSLSYNMRACGAHIVCLQQLNLFSKEYEELCDLLGGEWSSIASHNGEMRMSSGALSGLAVFSRYPIERCEVVEVYDKALGMEDVHRRAFMACEVRVAQGQSINVVNVCFEEVWEKFRISQLERVHKMLRMLWPGFCEKGFVLAGALNGLVREDYSDGAWDFEVFERDRKRNMGAIIEAPKEQFMRQVLGAEGYRDVRKEAGYSMVFEDGAKVEASGRHDVRTDYILLSKSLGWHCPHECYDVLPPPQHTYNCHHIILCELAVGGVHSRPPTEHEGRPPYGARRIAIEPPSYNNQASARLNASPPRSFTAQTVRTVEVPTSRVPPQQGRPPPTAPVTFRQPLLPSNPLINPSSPAHYG